jgi:phosphoglycerate kinase
LDFLTLDDFDLRGKKVLLRLDINSPIDPKTNEILDDNRIRSHLITLDALTDSKVIILAHQSRPGKKDFTTLEKHAKRIGELTERRVKYIKDIFGQVAEREIKALENGDILVLENVRFCSEEVHEDIITKPPEEQAKTMLVQKLSSYVDFYVNDAFAVAHRAQPSVVGFPKLLPSCAGRVMEKEVKILSNVLKGKKKPCIFILGGAKVKGSIKVMSNVLEKGIADRVLTAGLIANIFLFAKGLDLKDENRRFLEERGLAKHIDEAGKLLDRYSEKIEVPLDLAFYKNNSRIESNVNNFPNYRALDIGIETIVRYTDIINQSSVVVAKGPSGVFELREFALGSKELIKAIARAGALSVIGGGHLGVVIKSLNVSSKISHISTGGGALLTFLAGEKLPGIDMLKEVARAYRK